MLFHLLRYPINGALGSVSSYDFQSVESQRQVLHALHEKLYNDSGGVSPGVDSNVDVLRRYFLPECLFAEIQATFDVINRKKKRKWNIKSRDNAQALPNNPLI